MDLAVRILLPTDGGHDRRVELELAVHADALLGETRPRQLDGLLHLLDEFAARRALRREREVGDLRLVTRQVAVSLRRREANVHELLRRRVGDDGAVAEREHRVAGGGGLLQVKDEARGGRLHARLCAERVERGAEHVARRGDGAGDEAVHKTQLDHHAAEVDALRGERLTRGGEVDEFLLLGGLLRLLRVPRFMISLRERVQEIGIADLFLQQFDYSIIRTFDYFPRGIINHRDPVRGEFQVEAHLCLGGGDLLGRAKDDGCADLAVDDGARGRDDPRIVPLRENNRAVQL